MSFIHASDKQLDHGPIAGGPANGQVGRESRKVRGVTPVFLSHLLWQASFDRRSPEKISAKRDSELKGNERPEAKIEAESDQAKAWRTGSR